MQCALIAQRYSPYLKNYYERKKSRGTGKAIIARARKFLGIIYRTLRNKWVFADFPNFVSGGSNGLNPNTAAYASAPLSKASLRLGRLRGRLGHGDAKPEH